MISRERAIEIAKKYGIGEVPRDDPLYNEPPTIRFINLPPKPKETDHEDQ